MRPYAAADRASVGAVLAAAYAGDPVLREISSVHAEERGTLVAEEGGALVGVATLRDSDRHPTMLFLAGAVHPDHRRRGVGSALLRALPRDSRPLVARVRDLGDPGGCFLRRRGFGLLMRNVTAVVDPAAVERPRDVAAAEPAAPAELAAAHELAYRQQHASWAPAAERPLEESLRIFCGSSLVASVLVEGGVASLHGPPLADRDDELALVAGAADETTARALVAWALAHARRAGKLVSIEADEADAPFWRIAHELPHRRSARLFLLSTDVTGASVAT